MWIHKITIHMGLKKLKHDQFVLKKLYEDVFGKKCSKILFGEK